MLANNVADNIYSSGSASVNSVHLNSDYFRQHPNGASVMLLNNRGSVYSQHGRAVVGSIIVE